MTQTTIPPWEEIPNAISNELDSVQAREKRTIPVIQGIAAPTLSVKKTDIMDFFPLEEARNSQEIVLKEIQSVFDSGVKVVILEAPVGSGKSAIATTLARASGLGGAHVITPRKSLQDQYFDDFDSHMVLMKGRNSYPCTIDSTPTKYKNVISLIKAGQVPQPKFGEANCSNAPCRDSLPTLKDCTSERPCPYQVAMEVAQNHPVVVHNLHSFIFQASFGNKFQKRSLLIIDEAHEIESTVRDFISKKIRLPVVIEEEEVAGLKTYKDWEKYLLQDRFVPLETERDRALKAVKPSYMSERAEYLQKVAMLNLHDNLDKGFSVEHTLEVRMGTKLPSATLFEFIPNSVGSAVGSMLLSFGERVVLMSGTIYSKETFCKNLGIDLSSAHFIRVGSSFPKENRPLYCLPKYQVNTSHATWNQNFQEIVAKIKTISAIFHDVKGLIHTPSYMLSEQLRNALADPRFIAHQSSNFQEELTKFFASKEPGVFLSPVCQQGVDFKGDRARFQIILRVPYLNTSSKFIEDKVTNDFPWYNYQSLVTFGQQIGRVNRSADDFGATFLMDERFNKFLSRNNKVLPKWLKDALVFKS